MTTTDIPEDPFSAESDKILADGLRALEEMRAHVKQIEHARAIQPERLAAVREEAESARVWSKLEEPWTNFVAAIPAVDTTGARTGNSLTLPNLSAKEVFGARLAFDLLDAGDDFERIDEIQAQFFSMTGGDTGLMMLLAMSALSTIASLVVPQLLEEIETRGSNYDERVRLAEACVKAWQSRVDDLRKTPEGQALDDEDPLHNPEDGPQ